MAKYKIKINYQTGDSLGSENTSDYLELEWESLDIAKENLNAIKTHYNDIYREINYGGHKPEEQQEICKRHQNEWWFVKSMEPYCISSNSRIDEKDKKKLKDNWEDRFDIYVAETQIRIKADNGNLMQIRCFWLGYFEKLHGAKIEVDESDMEFET